MVEDPFTANFGKNRGFRVYGHLGKRPESLVFCLILIGVRSRRFTSSLRVHVGLTAFRPRNEVLMRKGT